MPIFNFPYRDYFGSGARPYLVLQLTGPNGRSGAVAGTVDSGADNTCLPMGYAQLMGYTIQDLKLEDAQHAGGSMDIWVAQKPASAYVVGLPDPIFDLWPSFLINSSNVLWGRADFFQVFGVGFDEPGQKFTLSRP